MCYNLSSLDVGHGKHLSKDHADDKGIFGMHIHQLVPDESHVTWWVPTSIGLPITIVLVVFVYLTRFAPSVHAEKDVGPAILPFNLPTPV